MFDKFIVLQCKSHGMFAIDYTYWDDMVKFVETGYEDWANENIEMVIPAFNANVVWIYKPDFTLVYSTNNLNNYRLNKKLFPEYLT